MHKKWVIGDIHGCAKTFRSLVEDKIVPSWDDQFFLLGDYVNKGPDSKGVIDYIFHLREQGYHIEALRGNHEDMLLEARYDLRMAQHICRMGGDRILQSFGVSTFGEIPSLYYEFMQGLPLYRELEGFILVHGGLNFELTNPFEDKNAMIWARDYTVIPEKINHCSLIHGHTPVPIEITLQQLYSSPLLEINLDNGCVYKGRPDMGHLLALELTTLQLVRHRSQDQ